MNPADADAVAEYLKDGGEVFKAQGTIAATDQEIIEYLATRGIHARYCDGDLLPYLCGGTRYSAAALVRLANTTRRAEQLPPFALRMHATPIRTIRTGPQED